MNCTSPSDPSSVGPRAVACRLPSTTAITRSAVDESADSSPDGTGLTSTLTTDARLFRNMRRCRCAMASTPSAVGSERASARMGERDVPGSIPSKKSTISMYPGDPGVAVFTNWDGCVFRPRPGRSAPATGVVARGVLASSIVSTESS